MENTMDIRVELGRRIRQIRKLKGLTQSKLADQAGLNENYYGEIERGLRNITLMNLQRIAVTLDVTLGELFRFPTETSISEEGEELVALVTRLLQKGSKRKIRQVLIIIRELVK